MAIHQIADALQAQSDQATDTTAPTDDQAQRHANIFEFFRTTPEHMREKRLPNWEATSPARKAVKAAVEKWAAAMIVEGVAVNLVLYGPCGTGKDHLAIGAVARVLKGRTLTAHWENCRVLFEKDRDRMDDDDAPSESRMVGKFLKPDILILSDPTPPLGESALSAWQADLLYRIVDRRLNRGLTTAITLNATNSDDAERRLGAPTWDRLCDGAYKLACFWRSFRKPAYEINPPEQDAR